MTRKVGRDSNPRRLGIRFGIGASLLLFSSVQAQIVIPTTGTLPPEPITRSLLLGDDLAPIQAWWASPVHAMQASWKSNIESYADRTLGPEPNSYSESILHSATAQSAALRWAMAGASEDLDKAIDALTNLKVVPSPSNMDITEAELTVNYLCAYDFVRGADIDPNIRSIIESKLLTAGNEIGDWSIIQQENNILAKRASTRALAGVLLRDQALLDNGLLRLNQSFNKTTTDDGWYTDSQGHYLNYILPHLIPFLRAYHTGSDVNLWPLVEPFITMTLGMRLPNGRTPNVQDGLFNTTGVNLFSRGVSNADKASLIYHFTNGDPPSFSNITNSDGTYVDFFWSNDFSQGSAPPSRSPTFLSPGQGKVTVFRNDWSTASDYLLLSPGIDGKPLIFGIPIGHNHYDTGEILLFTHGQIVFPAAGIKRTDWSNWPSGFDSKLAENHNVILVNGSMFGGDSTRPEEFVYTNRLDSTERGAYKGVCDFASLQYHYEGADIQRSGAFPNEDYFIVADVIESTSTNIYTFNLIGRGTLTTLTNSSDLMRVKWQIGGAQATENLVSTHAMTLVTDTTYAAVGWNEVEQTQRMKGQVSAANAGFLSVVETGANDSTPRLQVDNLSTEVYAATRVSDPNEAYADLILSQSTSSPQTIDGITTDGQFAYVRRVGGTIEGAMIAAGTQLADNAQTVFQASAPLTLSLLFGEGTIRGTISADGLVPNTEVQFYGVGWIRSASLNDLPIPFTNTPSYAGVTIAGGGELIIALSAPPTYTLSLTLLNGVLGSIDVSPNEPDYVAGALVTLTATANEGRTFSHWTLYDPNHPNDANYGIIDSNAVMTLLMDSDKHIEAAFKCGSGIGQVLPLIAIGGWLSLLGGCRSRSRRG